MYLYMYVYIYIYIYIHTRVYIYIYIYICQGDPQRAELVRALLQEQLHRPSSRKLIPTPPITAAGLSFVFQCVVLCLLSPGEFLKSGVGSTCWIPNRRLRHCDAHNEVIILDRVLLPCYVVIVDYGIC